VKTVSGIQWWPCKNG